MRFRSTRLLLRFASRMNERGQRAISADLFSLAPFRGEKATRSTRKGVCFGFG